MPRAFFESIAPEAGASFAFRRVRTTSFPFRWHFHPELELTLIVQGRGRRFVGDSIGPFADHDLVLLGGNLPHTWQSHRKSTQPNRLDCQAVVIQFRSELFKTFEQVSGNEFQAIARLLDRSNRGLQFSATARRAASRAMLEMQALPALGRLTTLIEILDILARDRRAVPISSLGYRATAAQSDQKRVTRVCGFLNEHFTRPIKLAEAADLVGLSLSAFARFFQRATGKQFTAYLSELRVGRACELLLETEKKVAAIAYESGFENLSHFNRTFHRMKDQTPREFRLHHVG